MKADESLPKETTLRSTKYVNNLIEQDHRNIKSRINAMLGFRRFGNAATTTAGIELMHRIRKGQFGPFLFLPCAVTWPPQVCRFRTWVKDVVEHHVRRNERPARTRVGLVR
jgi:hypothetical protein